MPDADFFFDFISPYSYLAQTQLKELAARTGARFKLWPMHLLNLMNIVGNTPTTVLCKNKNTYAGQDIARWSARYGAAFLGFMRGIASARTKEGGHLGSTHTWLQGLKNRALAQHWRDFYLEMTERFAVANPKMRVKWVGPDMSVRSSITARLMETWAHAQAVYDLLGQVRSDTDRIKNIAVLGINTFGWTFTNRGLAVPAEIPAVRLTAPSGAMWEWGSLNADNLVEGSAVEFCQVVTQVRNIADTTLRVVGATATRWMSIAQCFAGPPETPPAPGSRFRQVRV